MELDMVRVLLSVAIMAGVTYLLRMLPVTVFQKKNRKPVYPFFPGLCTVCGAGGDDHSGHLFRHIFPGFCGFGAGGGGIACLPGEKSPDRGAGRGCRGVFSRTPDGHLKIK